MGRGDWKKLKLKGYLSKFKFKREPKNIFPKSDLKCKGGAGTLMDIMQSW